MDEEIIQNLINILSDKHIVMIFDLKTRESFVSVKDATQKELFVSSALLDKRLCGDDLKKLEKLTAFKWRAVEEFKAQNKE